MNDDVPAGFYFFVLWLLTVMGGVLLAIPARILWAFVTANGGLADALKAGAASIGL